MTWTTNPARPRGMLNERERSYLLGHAEIDTRSQPERDIRATIRNRLRHAIYDFAILFDHMEDRDIEQVFDPRADESAELRTAIEDTIGFLYRATINFHPPFQYLAKEGIQRAEHTHFDRYVKATVDVEATAPIDPAEIRQRIEERHVEGLTPEEAMWIAETIVESGDFSFEEVSEAHDQVRERQAGRKPRQREDTERDRD